MRALTSKVFLLVTNSPSYVETWKREREGRKGRSDWRLQHPKILNLLPPEDTPNLQLCMDIFPLKKIWKWDELISTTKVKRTTSRWVGKADKYSCKKLYQTDASPWAKGWCFMLSTWVPGKYIKETSPQNVRLGKPMGLMFRGPKKVICPPWRPCMWSCSLRPSEKTAFWKAPRLYVRELHLLTWEYQLEGQGTVEMLPGDGVTGRCCCVLST